MFYPLYQNALVKIRLGGIEKEKKWCDHVYFILWKSKYVIHVYFSQWAYQNEKETKKNEGLKNQKVGLTRLYNKFIVYQYIYFD